MTIPGIDHGGCTCFHVRSLARRVTQFYDRALAPCGLRVTQYSLMTQLAALGPTPMGPLADLLDMDRTTLTRNLKPLIDAKLIVLARSPGDARVRTVALTASGRARRRVAHRLWRHAQDLVDAELGATRVAALHRRLAALTGPFHDAITAHAKADDEMDVEET
jgi:DNA-binding MarR family transcriptional regulator